MSTVLEAPPDQIIAGERRRFAIGAILPHLRLDRNGAALPGRREDLSPTAVLQLTDGFVTFYVAGINVFRIEPAPAVPESLRLHSSLCLSMLLEWLFFDRAYDLAAGSPRSFGEVINGEGAPDLRFERQGERVLIAWNFDEQIRCGAPFRHPVGEYTIDYATYLRCLKMLADSLIAAIDTRAELLGALSTWRLWLDGYAQEREAFTRYIRSALELEPASR